MRFLNNLKLLTKLAIPVTIFVAITVGLIFLADVGLNHMAEDTQELVEQEVARQVLTLQINAEVNEASIQEKNIILYEPGDLMNSAAKQFDKYKDSALQHADELLALADTAERKANYSEVKTQVTNYFGFMEKSIERARVNDDSGALKISSGEGRDVRIKIRGLLAERIEGAKKSLAQAADDADALASSTSWMLMSSAALGIIAALGLIGAIMIYGVTRPLGSMTSAMGRLAAGDLDVSVTGTERRDEVGLL
ncbi:MCP four helix bundle domain-containing protein, partial [Microvirga soli]|uniref:MCP four helix bundle domain-containing protein n=1 Tax=Microvirga soli TaxID=1854496 RepID=UPI00191E07AC